MSTTTADSRGPGSADAADIPWGAGTPDAAGAPLHGRFLRGLAVAPHRPAFRVDGHEVTYAEAHAKALAWAGALAHATEELPRTVAVLATKSEEAYVGLLAALYLGAAAVPMHPGFPAARNRAVLEAAAVDAVIADRHGLAALDALPEPGPGVPVLAPSAAGTDRTGTDRNGTDRTGPDVLTRAPAGTALLAPREVRHEDIAYILFTSGSTGRPKGVPTTHGATDSYFRTLDARYGFGPDDVFTQTFDLTFDCAMFDLFCAWGAGGCVVPLSARAYHSLPAYLAEQQVTVWFSTPGAIALARRAGALAPGALPGLRWSLFAGDVLHRKDADEWQAAAPASAVENLYGPTELTITVTAHRLAPDTPDERYVNGAVPIGTLHDTLDAVLLAPGGTDAAAPAAGDGAVEGELCVTGPQMFSGYLDPAEDEGRFVERAGRRYYRTGDRVRRYADGEIAYLGRADDQAQVNGWRVEPAEVGHSLRGLDGVEDAVVVAVETAPGGGHQLAGFYTGRRESPAVLARHLAEELPAATVPRLLHHLDEFPLNANRKTDRTALKELAAILLDGGGTRR
ncbi:AMP-binding protein [Streptomyces sp. NPDC093510]|uniref:AMP-binding protein n=1 Tax=Streptomyces sp. NPDC093510 TaxID=3155199 RepID=UPI0034189596